MLVSVFTPSHNPEHLPEVWDCLQEQTYRDWEWVVVANGPAREVVAARVEQLAGGDPRVRVEFSDHGNVGALKRAACDASRGDLYLEYDHDDLITHDCLEEVVRAAKACPAASFIYSDDVTCDWDGRSQKFMASYGWRYYQWSYKGRDYTINAQPEPHPRALCEILYSPDHVRVWTKDAYRLAGGHNPELRVGDDHELIVRTYLKGVHFHHIKRPLYLHRLAPTTTSQQAIPEIQAVSRQTRDRYLHALVREWCRREKLPMYDLGGAHNCPHGFIPVDTNPAVRSHPKGLCCNVFNLGDRVRLNSVGCFRAVDFLEHVPGPQIPGLLNMLYDLLVPGGFLVTMTPAVCDDEGRCGRGAFQDPTHVSFWSSNNWWYYTKKDYAKYVPEIRCRFQTVRLFNTYPSEFHKAHLIPYVFGDFCAIKDDRPWPGPLEI